MLKNTSAYPALKKTSLQVAHPRQAAYMLQFPYSEPYLFHKYMVICIMVFCLMFINSFAKSQAKPAVAASVSLRGAELYADLQEKGKITLYLKKYYDCGSEDVAETEIISMQEAQTSRIDPPVSLKKQSQEIQENKHLHFGEGKKGCVTVITYSAEVDLGEKRMNHIITWGYCCFEPTVINLDRTKRQGFALTLNINNDGSLQKNAMPSFTELPAFIMKQNTEVSRVLGVQDKDGDKLAITISTPYSLISEAAVEGGNVNADYSVAVSSSLITPKAPFKKIDYAQGFSEKNPIDSKLFSVQEHTGMFRYKPAKMGKYVAAVTIKDTREGKTLSEHQCVFLIDVLQQ